MAIPNDTDVVFYHPLNTRDESVSGATWDGTVKFSPGRVGPALSSAPTLVLGAESTFSDVRVLPPPPVMAALGAGRVAIAYLAEPNAAWLRIGQASGGLVTWGAGAQIAPNFADRVSLAALSSGVVVVSYHRTIDSSSPVSVFDVSGVDATLRESSSIPGTVESLGALSPDAFAVSFVDGTGGLGTVGTISAGLAFGPPSSYTSGSVAGSLVLSMSPGAVLVFYEDSTSAIKVRPGAISGSPLRPIWGPEVTIAVGQGSPQFSATMIDTSSFVIAYVDVSGARIASGMFGGGVVTVGAPIPGLFPGPVSVAAVSYNFSTLVAMMYRVPTSPDDRGASVVVATVSGLLMELGAETQFSVPSGSMRTPGLAANAGQVFATYSEGAIGKSKVGGVSVVAAELFAPPGTINPTVVGAGRIVFMSWTRNPS